MPQSHLPLRANLSYQAYVYNEFRPDKGDSVISVGGFEYDDDEGEDFNGLFCTICDKEMGYDPCVNCEDEKEIEVKEPSTKE